MRVPHAVWSFKWSVCCGAHAILFNNVNPSKQETLLRLSQMLAKTSSQEIVKAVPIDFFCCPPATEIVPEKWHREMFTHTLEGPDDMTGHVKVMYE